MKTACNKHNIFFYNNKNIYHINLHNKKNIIYSGNKNKTCVLDKIYFTMDNDENIVNIFPTSNILFIYTNKKKLYFPKYIIGKNIPRLKYSGDYTNFFKNGSLIIDYVDIKKSNFDNLIEYFNNVDNESISLCNKNYRDLLFIDDVVDLLITPNNKCIFRKSDNNIYLLDTILNSNRNNNDFNFFTIELIKYKYNYSLSRLKFYDSPTGLFKIDNFYYLKLKDNYHMLISYTNSKINNKSPYYKNFDKLIFECNIENFNPNNIVFYNNYDTINNYCITIYYIDNNTKIIWKYSCVYNKFVILVDKFIFCKISKTILSSKKNIHVPYFIIYYEDKTGYYVEGNCVIYTKKKISDILLNMLIVIDNEKTKIKYSINNNIYTINLNNDKYIITYEYLMYINNNKLYIVTNKEIKDKYIKLSGKCRDMYRYKYTKFNNLNNIFLCSYSNNILFTDNDDSIYNIEIIGGDYRFLYIIKIPLLDNLDTKVMSSLIKYNFIDSLSIDINVNISEPILDFMLNLMMMYGMYGPLDIYFTNTKRSTIMAEGEGVCRYIVDKALSEFKSTYLINSTSVSFNFKNLSQLSEEKIYNLGLFIHYVISFINDKFPFPLPLCLAEAIKGSDASVELLEYFINNIDQRIFNFLIEIKFHPNKIIDTGYDTYNDALKAMCGYPVNEPGIDTNKIINLLSEGFCKYSNIKNIDKMNIITLHNYICGSSTIDKKNIINKMVFKDADGNKFNNINIINKFKNIVDDFTVDQIKNMLRNLTGFSSPLNDSIYTIKFSSSYEGIKFVSCNSELMINPQIDSGDIIELLTHPIDIIDDGDYYFDENSY